MRKHIFFRKIPDEEFLLKLLKCFGVESFGQDVTFTKEDLVKMGTVDQVTAMQEELQSYYIPCKARVYVVDLTPQKCITILRQILRLHTCCLFSNQKMKDGIKRVHYTIVWTNSPPHLKKKTENVVLSFV